MDHRFKNPWFYDNVPNRCWHRAREPGRRGTAMDTSSDSDGPRSPGVYGQMAYAAAGHGDPVIVVESPSRHSESSSSGGVDESRTKAHHKFSIDRILGRFGGGNVASSAIDSVARPAAETSPDKSHGGHGELASSGAAGESQRPRSVSRCFR